MMYFLLVAAVAFAVTQAATLTTTVYLHRALAHKAVTLSRPAALAFRAVLWITTGLRPREWVAVHRLHHATADTPDDPHSPLVLGFWRVQLANAGLYRRVTRDGRTVARYARDLPPDRLDRVLFDRAWLGLGLGIALLILFLGVWGGLLAAGLHTVLYLGLSAAVNAVGHRFGARPHANPATNNLWLAVVTCGEGWHNNHHAAPTSARLGFTAAQLDPGWWTIRALELVGSAKVRHRRPKLTPVS